MSWLLTRFHYNVLVTDEIKEKYRLTTLQDQVQVLLLPIARRN